MTAMTYRFRVTNPDDAGFLQEYLLPGGASFETFRLLLERQLGLDPSQLVSFNVPGPHWESGLEITMMDLAVEDPEYPMVSMQEFHLQDLMAEVGAKLLFTYDLLSNRALFVELVEVIEGDVAPAGGQCTLSQGSLPAASEDPYRVAQRDIDGLLGDLGTESRD